MCKQSDVRETGENISDDLFQLELLPRKRQVLDFPCLPEEAEGKDVHADHQHWQYIIYHCWQKPVSSWHLI